MSALDCFCVSNADCTHEAPVVELAETDILRAQITQELREAALAWDAARARSQQTDIGASDLGHPCDRYLFHKATNTPEGDRDDPWLASLGTAAHEYILEPALTRHAPAGLYEVGVKLDIAPGVKGTGDALRRGGQPIKDRVTIEGDVVIDHKIMGLNSLRDLRLRGAKPQYRVQVQGYGFGYVQAGYDVKYVAIAGWPRNNKPSHPTYGLHVWLEPYDEQIVEDALQRWYRISEAAPTLAARPELIPYALATADGPCSFCPFRDPERAATDPRAACAGDPNLADAAIKKATAGLIA